MAEDSREALSSSLSLQEKIDALPEKSVQLILANAGVLDPQFAEGDWPKESWAFTRHCPSCEELQEKLEERNDQGQAAAVTPSGVSYLAHLKQSSTFACPDGTEPMLEAYGIPSRIFQGSIFQRDHGDTRDAQLASARARLKADIQLAWSQETVGRGVNFAKAGNYDAAHECYKQALELCASNPDALVAAGAAYANQQNFSEALRNFDRALALRPEDANANKYRQAVTERMTGKQLVDGHEAGCFADGPPQQGSAANQPGPSMQHDRSGKMPAEDKDRDHDRGGGGDSGIALQPVGSPAPRSSESSMSSPAEDVGPMDTEEALRIVSKHYRKRKVFFPFGINLGFVSTSVSLLHPLL